jgi:hypothetical protein
MKQGIVKGSVTEAAPTKIIGSGRFKIGSVNLEACISPGLDSNLLSAGKLIKEGYEIQLKKEIKHGVDVIVKKNNKEILTGHIESYILGHFSAKILGKTGSIHCQILRQKNILKVVV